MLRCWSLAIVLDLLGPALSGVQDYPVNLRPTSPVLWDSLDIEKTFKIECNEAHKITIDISLVDRKNLKWPPNRQKMRFASQPDGTAWPGDHGGWVCSRSPMEGTVTYDCLPEVEAPEWFKTAIPGPARGPHMREAGCNGAVCYCNDGDFCNCKGSLCSAATSLTSRHLLLLLASLSCLRYL